MDTKIIEYIVEIAEQKSLAKAAENLFITQSALNQSLQKIEAELGAPIFIRMRNRWELTNVGKLYVNQALRILEIKRETYSQIEDMSHQWNGTIKIGLTPERGVQMFTEIYPQIHEKYPLAIFQPVEATVETQVKLLESGNLDIGFQTIIERKYKHLHYSNILTEPFILCVPQSISLNTPFPQRFDEFPEITLSQFQDTFFTLVRKTSTMRIIIDALFDEAGFKPKLLFEATSMRTMQTLASNGLCCSIIPRCYVQPTPGVHYYSLGKKARWELVSVYRKGHHINEAARDFMKMASDYWRSTPYLGF